MIDFLNSIEPGHWFGGFLVASVLALAFTKFPPPPGEEQDDE
jgi:hypothetical protein